MLPNNHNSDKITAGLMLTQLFCCGGFFFRERECMDDEAKNKNDVIAAVKSFTILLLC